MMIAERVRTDLHASRIPVGEGHLCRWAQAMTDYSAGSRGSGAVAPGFRPDAGRERRQRPGGDPGRHGYPIAVGSRRTGLKQAIQSALEENRYELATETLTSANGSLVRTEAMLMLRTAADQMPIPATLFIPPAVRLDRWPTATCRRWRWACNGWPRTKASWPCASPCPRCAARNSSASWPCC